MLLPLLLLAALGGTALAQEATNTPAATQPSVGKWYLREKVQYERFADDAHADQQGRGMVVATTTLARGLTRNLSASVELPVVHRGGGSSGRTGLADPALAVKWRPWQRDLGPVDSVRFAVFGGVEAPSGDDHFSSDSWDPFVGGVATAILGRHGFNQSVSYKLNGGDGRPLARAGDGPDNALRLDTAYLFRIDPVAYTARTSAATYVTLELNGLREDGGDHEVFLGPGLLYEARTYALEATVGLPVARDLSRRSEAELRVTLGARLLF
jgi:hypothetical protein